MAGIVAVRELGSGQTILRKQELGPLAELNWKAIVALLAMP